MKKRVLFLAFVFFLTACATSRKKMEQTDSEWLAQSKKDLQDLKDLARR